MDKSFDLGVLLKNHEMKQTHKPKPTRFVSVAGGVKKRLEINIKNRKCNRLSIFDSLRELPQTESPVHTHLTEDQLKIQHRRLELQRWKQEKEKKKREAAEKKKKPFVIGVPPKPLYFVPLPPIPLPSTSGMVTRSQSAKNNIHKQKLLKENTPKKVKNNIKSFAPKHATFRPPCFENITVPTLGLTKNSKDEKNAKTINFDPVLPSKIEATATRQTRSGLVHNKQTVVVTDNFNHGIKVQTKSTTTRRKNTKTDKKDSTKDSSQHKKTSKSFLGNGTRKSLTGESKSIDIIENYKTNLISKKHAGLESKSSSEEKLEPPKLIVQSSISTTEQIVVASTKRNSRVTLSRGAVNSLQHENTSSDSDKEKSLTDGSKSLKSATESSNTIATAKNLHLPKSESSSEEKLKSPNLDVHSTAPLTPEQIVEVAVKMNSRVTWSRGKDNARKEMLIKIKQGLLDEDEEDADDVVDVTHFREQLASEIARMTQMCENWENISSETTLPDNIQELVLGAVGQARLLMTKKLQQFAGLVERCARPSASSSDALVTTTDLQGFWDMVFIQIEDVDSRFKKLEDLRSRNWVEEQPQQKKKATKPRARATTGAAPARSGLRNHIAAARKAKKQKDNQSEESNTPPASEAKTFEAGFFHVSSPVRSSVVSGTPINQSLLKTVLSSEAKKASMSMARASLTMVCASLLSKSLDTDTGIEGVEPLQVTPEKLTPINLHATPARSILKSGKGRSRKSHKNSIKTVLFTDSNTDAHKNISPSKQNNDRNTESNIDDGENKRSSRRRSQLIRQDALDIGTPVMTRSICKAMMNTSTNKNENILNKKEKIEEVQEEKTRRRSYKKKPLQEFDSNALEIEDNTPKRSSRRKSVLPQ